MNILPNTVKQAREVKSKFYFTGKACKHGHIDKRITSNKTCYSCDKLKGKEKPFRSRKDYYKEKREHILQQQATWRRDNKGTVNAKVARRRALKINATPCWADLDKIREIYKACPEDMVVDHRIPLKNKRVCGLHVENNLQYLTPQENAEKGNKFLES